MSSKGDSLATIGYVPAPVDSIYVSPADGIAPAPGVPLVWLAGKWCQVAEVYVNTNPTGIFAQWDKVFEDSLVPVITDDGTGHYTATVTRADAQVHPVTIDWGDNRTSAGATPAALEHYYAKAGTYEILVHNTLDGQYIPIEKIVQQPTYEHQMILTQVGTASPQKWHVEIMVPAKANDNTATCSVSINGVQINAALRFTDGVAALEHQFTATDGGDQTVAITYPGMVTPLDGVIHLATLDTPQMTSVTPTSAAAGAVVALVGSNFSTVTGVTVGGVTAKFTAADDKHMTVTLPAHADGAVDIVATNPDGTGKIAFTMNTPKKRTFQQEVVARADYFLRLSASGGVYDKPADPDGSIAVAIIDDGGGKFMVDIWLVKGGKWVRIDGPGAPLGATFGPFASGEGDASNVYVRGFNYPSGTMLHGDPMQTGKATDLAFGDDGTLNTEHGPEGSYVLPSGVTNTNVIGWWYDEGTSADVFINEVP